MTQPIHDAPARLRRSVYLLLIFLGAGSMLGRILAVDAVDQTAIEEYRFKRELAIKEKKLREMGLTPEGYRKALQRERRRLLELLPPLRRPFLSSNDRSRWCTIRALVEEQMRVEGAPYAVDKVIREPTWDTIDLVKHDGHLYSSKPTLLPTLLAGEYWLLRRLTGVSLGTDPFWMGRVILITVNLIPLLIYFLLLARLVERWGQTDWGKLFVAAAAVFGTFLSTFAMVLNNHVPAAVSAVVAVYAAVPIWFDGQRRWRYFVVAGLFAALTAANELPATSLFALLTVALLWKCPARTLLAYVPAALVVAAGFFGTNWIAHRSLLPPYFHRQEIVRAPLEEAGRRAIRRGLQEAGKARGAAGFQRTFREAVEGPVKRAGREAVKEAAADLVQAEVPQPRQAEVLASALAAIDLADVQARRPANWYDYAYQVNGKTVDSYWRDPQGIDRGEPSRAAYAFHVLIGHHGIFSLTPIWLLAAAGLILWTCNRPDRRMRPLALLIGVVSIACLVFLLMRPVRDCNYGGMTCGFRWMFWLAPLWLLAMLPAADAMARRGWTRLVALVLLALSVLSASYPVWNPWTHPWIFEYLHYLGRL